MCLSFAGVRPGGPGAEEEGLRAAGPAGGGRRGPRQLHLVPAAVTAVRGAGAREAVHRGSPREYVARGVGAPQRCGGGTFRVTRWGTSTALLRRNSHTTHVALPGAVLSWQGQRAAQRLHFKNFTRNSVGRLRANARWGAPSDPRRLLPSANSLSGGGKRPPSAKSPSEDQVLP